LRGFVRRRILAGAVGNGDSFSTDTSLANLGALRAEALLVVPAMAISMLLAERFFGADR